MQRQTHMYSDRVILVISDHAERAQSKHWIEIEIRDTAHLDLPLSVSRAKFLQAALVLISAEVEATTRRLDHKFAENP